jgi:hypothetical protein
VLPERRTGAALGNRQLLPDTSACLNLADNLFRLATLPRHIGPPRCQKTYFKSDHFNEGGSPSRGSNSMGYVALMKAGPIITKQQKLISTTTRRGAYRDTPSRINQPV